MSFAAVHESAHNGRVGR
jgi:hypothetical protein